jgi:uncharacterized membrane protein
MITSLRKREALETSRVEMNLLWFGGRDVALALVILARISLYCRSAVSVVLIGSAWFRFEIGLGHEVIGRRTGTGRGFRAKLGLVSDPFHELP